MILFALAIVLVSTCCGVLLWVVWNARKELREKEEADRLWTNHGRKLVPPRSPSREKREL